MTDTKNVLIAILGLALAYLLYEKHKSSSTTVEQSQKQLGLPSGAGGGSKTSMPPGSYKNDEKWFVKWDPGTMLPTEIEVKRDARRG